ncbi:hypothetical protein [uncultured Parolsenella sp.]|uniref:ribbon-helix-helix protein n=1 Tax=uncultured Parolsenella sp. TaxID=2083008 RepID=UPI0025DD8FA1|nr:hypothetical protein [uncultured Parolsenella sp.]
MEAKAERTTIQVSITVEDKTALKIMAAERGMTVAALIHEWIEREKGEAKQ